MTLHEQYLGDTKTHALTMVWEGEAYELAAGESLLFTAKFSASDTDADAAFQKVLGAGITVEGSVASIAVVGADTAALAPGNLVCDIQATRADGSTRTVWKGAIKLHRDISRLSESSVPIHTTEPPLPGAITLAGILAAIALDPPAARAALGIPTYANLAAANEELTIGMGYYDEELETLNTATAAP